VSIEVSSGGVDGARVLRVSTYLRPPAQTILGALSTLMGTLGRASEETIVGRLDGAWIFLAGGADGH
jgi:hypothetical protein